MLTTKAFLHPSSSNFPTATMRPSQIVAWRYYVQRQHDVPTFLDSYSPPIRPASRRSPCQTFRGIGRWSPGKKKEEKKQPPPEVNNKWGYFKKAISPRTKQRSRQVGSRGFPWPIIFRGWEGEEEDAMTAAGSWWKEPPTTTMTIQKPTSRLCLIDARFTDVVNTRVDGGKNDLINRLFGLLIICFFLFGRLWVSIKPVSCPLS